MQKELIEQVQRALKAQQDTIERQEQMLNEKDRDIAILRASLKELAQTQSEELKRLPSLFKSLENSIRQYTSVWSEWQNHRKTYTTSMRELATEAIKSCSAQIQLIELMKEYQSTIVPDDTLKSDTERLERKLKQLMSTQREIDSSQQKITGSQQTIQKELMELSKLMNK